MSGKFPIPNDICIIIPAYNAQFTIKQLLEQISTLYNFHKKQIIVINDGSSDNTENIIKKFDITIITNSKNQGKSFSLIKATSWAGKNNFKYAIFIDADLQHPPKYIKNFIKKLQKTNSDLIIGKRKIDNHMPFQRKLSNFLGNLIVSLVLQKYIPDTQSGFRLINIQKMEKFTYKSIRYELETEILIKFVKNNFNISYVDIPTIYNEYSTHFNILLDLIRFFYIIFISLL